LAERIGSMVATKVCSRASSIGSGGLSSES